MVVEDLALVLEVAGVGTLGTDIRLHVAPDDPDNLMVLIDYAGDTPEWVQDKQKVDTENPRVQVAVRGTQPEEVRLRAEQAYQTLMTIENEVINGTRYLWCQPVDTPSIIGRDESGRHLATVNFRVKKELSNV